MQYEVILAIFFFPTNTGHSWYPDNQMHTPNSNNISLTAAGDLYRAYTLCKENRITKYFSNAISCLFSTDSICTNLSCIVFNLPITNIVITMFIYDDLFPRQIQSIKK